MGDGAKSSTLKAHVTKKRFKRAMARSLEESSTAAEEPRREFQTNDDKNARNREKLTAPPRTRPPTRSMLPREAGTVRKVTDRGGEDKG